MPLAFIVDFDGTVTQRDVGASIIKKYAEDGWQRWEDMWIERKISTEMCCEMMWGMINTDAEVIKDYVNSFEFTPGFEDFCNFANKNGHKIIIASDGFDFYIDVIMKKLNLKNFEIKCCHLEYSDGWKFNFPNLNKKCGKCGTCKKTIVDNLKSSGYTVCYAGDGYSDRCGCKNSDIIFAKSYLANYCKDEKISYIEFKDFYQIMNYNFKEENHVKFTA